MNKNIEDMEKRLTALEQKVQEQSTDRWLWIATTVIVAATLVIQLLKFMS